MSVPEASMNKNNRFIFWQYNIRCSWQIFSVQPETVSHFMQYGPNDKFRFCVFPFYTGHVPASSFFANYIHLIQCYSPVEICCKLLLPFAWQAAEALHCLPVCIVLYDFLQTNNYLEMFAAVQLL